jgi:hypothetical protein
MFLVRLLPLLAVVPLAACGGSPPPAPAAAAAEDKAAKDKEQAERIEARKRERLAKEEEKKQKEEEIKKRIQEVTVIPEGTKIPKKPAEACELVVKAQEGFMKKFHPQVDASAITTQLGLLRKQCVEMNDAKVAMCQKFALEATDELLKTAINEYLPVCMEKYPSKG